MSLRFIIEHSRRDSISDATWKTLETIDIDVPELENLLCSGGLGETGHSIRTLIGVEIKRKQP